MTAPVLDPVRSAPAPERRRATPPETDTATNTATNAARPKTSAPSTPAPERAHLRVLRPGETLEVDRARLVRQLAIAATAIAALCLFGIVVFHVLLTQNQFHLDKLQEESLDRQAEYDRLRLQVAELESPDRIVASAQSLGMVTPPKVTYLAPTVEERNVDDSPAPEPRGREDAASVGESGWSTVKPHLADG